MHALLRALALRWLLHHNARQQRGLALSKESLTASTCDGLIERVRNAALWFEPGCAGRVLLFEARRRRALRCLWSVGGRQRVATPAGGWADCETPLIRACWHFQSPPLRPFADVMRCGGGGGRRAAGGGATLRLSPSVFVGAWKGRLFFRQLRRLGAARRRYRFRNAPPPTWVKSFKVEATQRATRPFKCFDPGKADLKHIYEIEGLSEHKTRSFRKSGCAIHSLREKAAAV